MKRTFLRPPTKEGEAPTPIVIYVPRGKARGRGTPGAFGGVTKATRKLKQQVAQLAKTQELREAHKMVLPEPPAT